MAWTSLNTARRVGLLLACLASVLCSPVSGFVRSPTSLSSVPSYPGASHQCNNRPVHFLLIASSTSTSPLAPSAFGGTRQAQRAHKPPVVAVGGRGGASSRLWMSSPAPPVKPVCSTFSRNCTVVPQRVRFVACHVTEVAAAPPNAGDTMSAPQRAECSSALESSARLPRLQQPHGTRLSRRSTPTVPHR